MTTSRPAQRRTERTAVWLLLAGVAATVSSQEAPAPTPVHFCDDGQHGCDTTHGVCLVVGDDFNEWGCACQDGYLCTAGCTHPHIGHTCALPPTPAPTPVHQCDDGSHGCDKGPGGECHKIGSQWACGCLDEYMCVAGCEWPHIGHTCTLTAAPTPSPTPATTLCDSPSTRVCATDDSGGLCAITYGMQLCSCIPEYHCISGCNYPFSGHGCKSDTESPTQHPTASPTAEPTFSPTPSPTASPTPACVPGTHRTAQGACTQCDAGKFSNVYNAVDCTACEDGTYAVVQSIACTDCPAGTYHPSSGSTCHACATGTYSVWTRQNNCFHCPSGKFQDSVGYSLCHECNAGTWTAGGIAQTSCAPIPML